VGFDGADGAGGGGAAFVVVIVGGGGGGGGGEEGGVTVGVEEGFGGGGVVGFAVGVEEAHGEREFEGEGSMDVSGTYVIFSLIGVGTGFGVGWLVGFRSWNKVDCLVLRIGGILDELEELGEALRPVPMVVVHVWCGVVSGW
jgi:hypothetical protein